MAYYSELPLADFMRGDTFRDIYIENILVGEAPAILEEVRVQLRSKTGALLHNFATEMSGASGVIIKGIHHSITEQFPVGQAFLEVEVTSEGIGRVTLLRGSFNILGDITR